MRKYLIAALALAVAGCASTSPPPSQGARPDCLDGARSVRSFEVIGTNHVEITQMGGKRYRLQLVHCPHLDKAHGVSFASGPDRIVGYRRGQPLWASPIDGNSRICGRGGDRLVVRDRFFDVGEQPSVGCSITNIQRLD